MNGLASLGHIAQQPHKNTKHRFIHFSQNTDGRCGRPVYIDAQLLPDFLAAVDISNFSGLEVVKKIEQLRALGGGINSHQNKDIANSHKCLMGKVEVHYYITQATAKNSGGIYITNVGSINNNKDETGLYRYQNGIVRKNDNDFFALEQAFIGSDQSIDNLTNRFKPYAEVDGWNSLSYEIFFSPSYDIDKHGTWITPAQKIFNESQSIVDLAKILQKTQQAMINKSGSFTKIRVFDSSSGILDKSLTLVKGHLDKLGFEFIDPDATITSTIRQLASKNAKLSKSPVQITSRRSKITLTKVRNQISSILRSVGRPTNALEVTEKTNASSIALSVGGALSHSKSNFITAARQANLLGKWQG
ncbi:hypothetical protein QWY82_05870 [Simiduia curdlanivorans]|uniref:Uncharacterized protein n=1 Tax=Simiduia curdlanivorans TaxID=1492769 RepID=A0ABV8V5A5_9GAMM|nr:hypothetical protein [Simiduia curdlanivorans]MDN3638339.1 hypothetical protein [Simiduia curdlanivorans]